MNTFTTKLTDEELIRVSRAMERSGFSSIEEYLRWAVSQQNATILGTED